MELLSVSIPALAVASIYCLYDVRRREREREVRKDRRLRERIAFMLWLAANEVSDNE